MKHRIVIAQVNIDADGDNDSGVLVDSLPYNMSVSAEEDQHVEDEVTAANTSDLKIAWQYGKYLASG